jgi:hypothetical protein
VLVRNRLWDLIKNPDEARKAHGEAAPHMSGTTTTRTDTPRPVKHSRRAAGLLACDAADPLAGALPPSRTPYWQPSSGFAVARRHSQLRGQPEYFTPFPLAFLAVPSSTSALRGVVRKPRDSGRI